MCGVLTVLTKQSDQDQYQKILSAMLQPLRESRGPDAFGVQHRPGPEGWQLYLAHARLSIIDISAEANQPMQDPETGLCLIYNGEIYNYKELRQELEGRHSFATLSDTEVLLAGLKVWGLESTLQKLRGMFAFVAFDPRENLLFGARDRAGEKPLSFGKVEGDWVFTSDLRVLDAHPQWRREVSFDKLKTYFRYRFVPHPQSIFAGFSKLGPGQLFRMRLGEDAEPRVQSWWSFAEIWSNQNRVKNADVRQTIRQVVKRTLEASDVPVGCFLSGGVDSSLVTALAQQETAHRLQAYTIQFLGPDYDESKQAKALAKALNVRHTVVPFGFEDFKKSFVELNRFLDEPAAVHSFYPLGFLAKRARQDVKVCLSGDGGDELFAGYNRYLFWQNSMRKLGRFPGPLRGSLAWLLKTTRGAQVVESLLRQLGQRQVGGKRRKIVRALESPTMESFYQSLLQEEASPLGPGGVFHPEIEDLDGLTSVERLMALDFNFYLPCDVLNKVDRATMACGLEARAPLLDLDVIEAAGRVPVSQKIGPGGGKWILKKWLNELVPAYHVDRAKSGFTTPIDLWQDRLFDQNFFDRLEASVIDPLLDPTFKKSLLEGALKGDQGFPLYCVVQWLEQNRLNLVVG
jgi:asparagine synthase (glutamine-hydrolysing)